MAKVPLRFKEADVVRAIRAATKAGGNRAVEILPNGVIRIIPAGLTEDPDSKEPNTWDS